MRPWLLLLWAEAWVQSPIGSLPRDDEEIALILGISSAEFQANRGVLLRKWYPCSDGRLYHPVITETVLTMMGSRRRDRERKRLNNQDSGGRDHDHTQSQKR
jgi:hypothetical protein